MNEITLGQANEALKQDIDHLRYLLHQHNNLLVKIEIATKTVERRSEIVLNMINAAQ